MKKISLVSFLFALFFMLPVTVSAQTTLDQGDIAFVGLYMDGLSTAGDGFTFILLKNVDAGTVIYFTDEGWDASNSTWYGNSNDAHFSWTAPAGGSSIGTIVHIENITATTYSTSSGTVSATLNGVWNLSSSGDQMLAYQSGSGVRPALPVFLTAIDADYYIGSTYDGPDGWGSSYYNQIYCSDLPSGLTNGVDCVAMVNISQPTEYDNYKYNGTLTGTASAIRAAINNYSNWTRNDDGSLDISVAAYATPNITDDSNPEINIQGNGNSIADGDAAPSATDHTDFGTTPVCSTAIVRTFTIENTGTAVLNISSVNISGTNAPDFSVTASPAASVSAAGSTTFQVTFNPSASGARNAVITVNSDDSDESAYDFAITGTGTNMTITPLSQTNVACNGGSNGAASANAATGGTGAYTYNWTPGNPTGDGTTSVTGLIAGTWTITATDANGCTATTSFTVTQPIALDMTLASKTDVSVYGGSNGAASFNAATGGAGGYTYNWTPGNPSGDGTLSVTGLTAGTWGCTVTDANSCAMYKEVTIIQPPAVTSSDASSVTADSAVMGGNASIDGGSAVTERGVVYSDADATPSIGEPGVIQDANGSGTGAFSKTISGLDPNTTYYYQAYAVNAAGTTYGGVKNFTTLKGTPEVTQWPTASMITYGDALSASTLDGGSASVPGTFSFKAPETVLNAGALQTVAVIFTPDSADYNTVEGTVTIDVDTAELIAAADDKSRNFGEENPVLTVSYSGFVNGDDSGDINSAPAASTDAQTDSPAGEYEIKVSGGSDDNYTFFYESGTLTVNAVMPSVTTAAVVNITSGSARTGGTVTDDGGGVIAKGVCYGESENPDLTGNCVKAVSLSETFKSALTELQPLTKYYLRSYATNSAGTAYGEQLDFTTLDAEVMIPAYELPVGAVVYDDTWEYDGTPLEWRVVNGDDTGKVTLSSTTGVGAMAYIAGGWNNKWPDSTMKVWLNTDFYGNFSPAFEDKVLDTDVPWVNTTTGGTLTDKVFIASKTELGGDARNGDGTVLDWFSDQLTAADRRGDVVCDPAIYWTRTGELGTHNSQWYEMSADYVFVPDGHFDSLAWSYDPFDTVPVLNISSDAIFELIEGRYRLFIAEPIVTFSAADIVYGQKTVDSSLSASTAEYEGSPVAGTFSFDEPDSAFDAGTYSVPVTFTPDDLVNYRIVKGSATLNVKKATPVITWEDPEDIVYGTALDGTQLNATADVPGTFVYSPDDGEVLNAGYSQTLRADFTPDDTDNYETAWKEVSINVDTVELTVTADNKSRNYGEDNPELTFAISGFVNGDSEDDIDTLPIASTTAEISSPAGDYLVTVSGGADGNYTFSYVDGTLTVNAIIPLVKTLAAESITTSSAITKGTVTNNGGSALTAKGICLGATEDPSTCYSVPVEGSGISLEFNGLVEGTTYHFRAYATNSVGTAYGSDMTFTVLEDHILTYTAGTNGSLTGTLTQTIYHGGNGTPVTAVADEGYHFLEWSDGDASNPRTDSNVMEDISVMAIFEKDPEGVCGKPEEITALPYVHNSTTAGRDSELTAYGTDCGSEEYASADYIYSLELSMGDKVEITLTPAEGFDGLFTITGICAEDEACLGYVNNGAAGVAETTVYEATEDRTIFIVVEGFEGSAGDYTLEVKEWIEEPDDDDVTPDEDVDIVDDVDTGDTATDEDTGDTGDTGSDPDSVIDEDTGNTQPDIDETADEDAGDTGNTGNTGTDEDSGDTGDTGNTGTDEDSGNTGDTGDTAVDEDSIDSDSDITDDDSSDDEELPVRAGGSGCSCNILMP